MPATKPKSRLIQVLQSEVITMAKVRYGVAGDPIVHSLSPIVTSLVHAHLSSTEGVKVPDLKDLAVIPASGIENALAWGYAGSLPSPPDWDLVGSPLGKFRANTLLERAVASAMEIEEADARLPTAEMDVVEFQKPPKGDEEVWMSLTSPLKHQLSAAAVKCVDNAMQTRSVNTLRWDGRVWWAASTDGLGILMVARAFGFSSDSVLGLIGGGGTARATAAAWCAAGGKVNQLGGRRPLDEDGPWELCNDEPDLTIDFDDGGGDIIVKYEAMEGDLDSRIEHLSSNADGRWLLCAQNLYSWAHLWSPFNAQHLPSLSLLMNRLLACEVTLS